MSYKITQAHCLPPHAFASIRTWAASVAPGSPAPLSPRRRLSVSSTASPRRSRRPSLVVLTLAQSPTSPVPVAADDAFDLTALGYTSVFVNLPETPTTPSPLLRAYDQKHRRPRIPPPPPAPAPSKRSAMRRFRSLSVLRPRAKQADAPGVPPSPSKSTASAKPAKKQKEKPTPVPTSTPLSATTAYSPAEICAATVLKRKRAKYAYVRPPPTLAQELAVMQFADGGSMEVNVRRAMERQAKFAAGTGAPVGVADVYRDGAGGIWWDADEELEYAHLLAGAPASGPVPAPAWEAFEPAMAAPLDPAVSRRTSLSSCDSDLDPARLLPLPEHEDRAYALPDDRALASRRIGGPMLGPVLCLPARPRRPAPHLARAHYAADVDMTGAFGRGAENVQPMTPPAGPRARGKARRRPPPLTLAPSAKRRRSRAGISAPAPPPAAELPAPPLAAHARREFLADSFAPPPAAMATAAPCRTPLAPLTVTRVPPLAPPPPASVLHIARRGVRGLFTRRQAV